MGQDYAYILAAEIGSEYPERSLVFINRGISGDRVVDLAARWQTDTLALKPNLLSILVGINDTLATGPKAETVAQYEADLRQAAGGYHRGAAGNEDRAGRAVSASGGQAQGRLCGGDGRSKEAAGCRLFDWQRNITCLSFAIRKRWMQPVRRLHADHWSWDGVHPTYAGHGLMAQEWLKTVDAFWGGEAAGK